MDEKGLKDLAEAGKDIKILIIEDNKMVQKMLDVLIEPYFKAVNIINNAKEAISHFEATKYDVVLINLETEDVKDTSAWETITSQNSYVIVYAINKDNQDLKQLQTRGVDTCVVESIKDDIDTLYTKLLTVSLRIEDVKAEKERAKNIIEDKTYDFESYCDMEEMLSVYEELDAIYGEVILSKIKHEDMINIYNILIRYYNVLSNFSEEDDMKDKLQSFADAVFDMADFMLFINIEILNSDENNAYKTFELGLENILKSVELGFKKGDLARVKAEEAALDKNMLDLKKELGIL
jgi:CheY-like chemotaxis protein